jgi:hypothetical protein
MSPNNYLKLLKKQKKIGAKAQKRRIFVDFLEIFQNSVKFRKRQRLHLT